MRTDASARGGVEQQRGGFRADHQAPAVGGDRPAADRGELPPLGGVRREERRPRAEAGEADGRGGAGAARDGRRQLRRLFLLRILNNKYLHTCLYGSYLSDTS